MILREEGVHAWDFFEFHLNGSMGSTGHKIIDDFLDISINELGPCSINDDITPRRYRLEYFPERAFVEEGGIFLKSQHVVRSSLG